MKSLFLTLMVLVAAAWPAALDAREPLRKYTLTVPWSPEQYAGQDVEIPGLDYQTAQVDTYAIVSYDFEEMNWQGWTRFDNTAQRGVFFHVEDYLEPELAGLPGPLEGTKSMWCGAPPGPADYMCGWASAPGYGNGWAQRVETGPLWTTGKVYISYRASVDCEPEWDRVSFELLTFTGEYDIDWVEVASYEGVVDTVASHVVYNARAVTKIRFHFESDGSGSDEDGLYASDGALHVDSITVASEGCPAIHYEDFESGADGDTYCGDWFAYTVEPFGMYSGLWCALEDKDPCNRNLGTQIVFFDGSDDPSDDYPGLYNTPGWRYDWGYDYLQQDEMVISPVIDMTHYSTGRDEIQDADIPSGELAALGGAKLRFTAYRGMERGWMGWVGYAWCVRNVEGGCPGPWLHRNYLYYGFDETYFFQEEEIGDLVTADSIQVALRVLDFCNPWYLGCLYSPAPWFDNVRVQRYENTGPQWSWRDVDLFQDNFPGEEFDLESWVRADMAQDVNPSNDGIIPGDSIVVRCGSPLGGGIAEDPFGPRVYMHVRCTYEGSPGTPKPDLAGPSLEGTYGRYVGDDGTWTVIQADTARAANGQLVAGMYMFDLNDSLFTRGYVVEYYFEAYDVAGEHSTLPQDAADGVVPLRNGRRIGIQPYFEFTCLPTLAGDILYVDDYHGIGTKEGVVQHYFDDSFNYILPADNQPDRYDVNGPSSTVNNGPGSRARTYQLKAAYTTVIWDSGDLARGTISDGYYDVDESDDCLMLIEWMNLSDHDCGLLVCGDNVAEDLDGSYEAQALELMSTWCGVALVDESYFDLTGGRDGGGTASPELRGTEGGIFDHTFYRDSLYAYGGCPQVNGFDVLGVTNNGQYALSYPDHEATHYYAAVQSVNPNSAGYDVRTMWLGFSWMYIRDCDLECPLVRYELLDRILSWMGMSVNTDITDAGGTPPRAYSLSQNYPNPFNPTTTIGFALRERGPVRVRIYDVAGRLVRTLVDEVRDAGRYAEVWDGCNNRGSETASGVYFYRMESGAFTATRKLVLLR